MLKIDNWKYIAGATLLAVTVAGGCAVDDPSSAAQEQALTGDHGLQDQATRYGVASFSGPGTRLAVIADGIGDATKALADINAMRAAAGYGPCPSCNIVNQFGFPTLGADNPAKRRDASVIAAEIAVADRNAPITIVVPSSRTASNLMQALNVVNSLGIHGVAFGFGLAPSDPGLTTVDAFLLSNAIVGTAGANLLPIATVVQVAATQYTTGADAPWSGSGTLDVAAVGKDLLVNFDGIPQSYDSQTAPAGMILGRLALQPGGIASRSTLLGASSSHFDPVTGVTKGTFKDGASL